MLAAQVVVDELDAKRWLFHREVEEQRAALGGELAGNVAEEPAEVQARGRVVDGLGFHGFQEAVDANLIGHHGILAAYFQSSSPARSGAVSRS